MVASELAWFFLSLPLLSGAVCRGPTVLFLLNHSHTRPRWEVAASFFSADAMAEVPKLLAVMGDEVGRVFSL